MSQLNEKIELKSGKYYLDPNFENYHSFKHFNLELIVKNDSLKLQYVSSEEFGYSKLWKKGDIYAEGILSDKDAEGIILKVWENRGDSKILTEGYFLRPKFEGFQLVLKTKQKDYIDHYSLKPHEFLLSQELATYQSNPENSESYHNEIQKSLLEFDIRRTGNWNEYFELLDRIENTDFPYKGIPTKREFLTKIGFSLGVRLNKEKNWEWAYIKKHRNDYLGWTIINPDKTIGIPIENYFFEKSFKYRDIKFSQLIQIINGEKEIEGDKNKLTLYEPWLNYEQY